MKENISSKRFVRVYKQGGLSNMEIFVDKQTGVNYLYHSGGYGGGMSPLLDSHGNVVVTRVDEE